MVTFTFLTILIAAVLFIVVTYGAAVGLVILDICIGLLPFILVFWLVRGLYRLFTKKKS